MGFLAPLVMPAVSAIGGVLAKKGVQSALTKTGLSLGASLLGNKLGKTGYSGAENTALGQQTQAQQLGLDTAKTNLPNAQSLIGMGASAYQPVINHWASILSGNRGAVTSEMAPEISRIGQGYQTAADTSAALNPRGGPSASFLSELPFAQQRDTTTLLQNARKDAAGGLLTAGNAASTAGNSLLSNAVNSIYNSTAAGRDILNSEQVRKAADAARGKSIGTGLFDMIQKYGFPAIDKIFKGGGIGGGGGDINASMQV